MKRKAFLQQYKSRRLRIIKLRDINKLTWAEIAEEMGGVSQTAVMNAYKREKNGKPRKRKTTDGSDRP